MPCDYSKYPANWKSEIRPAVLERANNCCEICKVPNNILICRGTWNNIECWQNDDGQIFRLSDGKFIGSAYVGEVFDNENQKAIKVVLTIAHLNHDTTDNRMENLKALCQLHHLRHDHTHHKKNAKETRDKKKKLQKLF